MRRLLGLLLPILSTIARASTPSTIPSEDKQPIGFTGYIKDSESGLYYARARYYDPELGRFLSEDPEAGHDMQPPSLHRYLYSYANPTSYVDPSGRQSLDVAGTELLYTRMQENESLRERGVSVQQRAEYFAGQDEKRAAGGVMAAVAALIGTEWIAAGGAAMTAYGTGGFVWGAHTFLMEAQGPFEATVTTALDAPIPSSLPMRSPAAAAAMAEEEVAFLSAQERAAASSFNEVPLPTGPSNTPAMPAGPPTASVVVEGARGMPVLAPMSAAPAAPELSMETGPHGVIKLRTDIPGQSHHLNQDAIYRDHIPREEGLAVKLEGNAFNEPNTPHYIVHQVQEQYLNQFRPGGSQYLKAPSNIELNKAMLDGLRAAGYTNEQAQELVRQAMSNRLDYGLLGGQPIPRIPRRINQVPSDEPKDIP